MKKQFGMLGIALGMICLPAMALAASDFSGSWVRNNAGSDPAPNAMYWLTRGGATMGGGRAAADVVLNVHQDARSLQVTESGSVVRNYTLDGNPHTRATDTRMENAVVTANLQGNTLVIETTQPFGGMPGNATLKIKEVWSLSPDGKTLTILTTRDLPARQQTYKQVYNRTEPTQGAICSAGCVVPH
jgi:hypothetical protein